MNSTVAVTAPAITEYTVTAADYTPVTTPAQTGTAPPQPKATAMKAPGYTVLTVQRAAGGSTRPGNPQKLLAPPATTGP